MDIPASKAVQAYRNTLNLAAQPQNGESDFSGMVGKALGQAAVAIRQGEQASIGALVNQVGIDELAVSIASAETTLRTVVAIRDRVIAAYQDIIKMPI